MLFIFFLSFINYSHKVIEFSGRSKKYIIFSFFILFIINYIVYIFKKIESKEKWSVKSLFLNSIYLINLFLISYLFIVAYLFL